MGLLKIPFLLISLAAFSSTPAAALKKRGFQEMDGTLFSWLLHKDSQPQKVESLSQGYMSNVDLKEAIIEIGQRCHHISNIYSIGKSVKGFPLLVIELSDKPGQEEAEPAFKFIGNVHGDEPVGRELLVRLANWLCNNYMKDPLATLIVKNVHLHILPSMNPDGFAMRRRGNANNVDLNRDFPDQFYPLNDVLAERQPETKAIIKWVEGRQFTASASLHGGALVANYPWDGAQDGSSRKEYFACPDDKTFRYMASVYSRSHYNMSSSKEFEGGIVNGALWYPIYGGMQDWNYINGGCLELTLEISDEKWPKADEAGIHGRIFASNNGRPLQASVKIEGIDYGVNAGRIFGDYHRMLAPRESYEVTASMAGFKTKTTNIFLEDEAVNLDFILDPAEEYAGNHALLNGIDHINSGFLCLNLYYFPIIFLLFLLFFCFLLKRKTIFKFFKQRRSHGQKSPTLVV
ncbi:carboxypeptidase SOL1 isoform X2 [Phalaenopsis equestris]|uniref:carboxypeptidase SOL1 isoform X2 n=1 Tax=Phalaenopsis equestris TaxID=78828 RepID=UPI0009E48632|nr:carboxypeptidase SOL1 isoform X2 [Phalaenopsis equestris]